MCNKAAVQAAYYNVKINAKGLTNQTMARQLADEAKALLEKNHKDADELLEKVEAGIGY